MATEAAQGHLRRDPGANPAVITLDDIEGDGVVGTYLDCAHRFLGEIGYTEHGSRHARLVALRAREVLLGLGFGERRAELAAIAGYLHDIGNVVSRGGHELASVMLAHSRLREMGMGPEELSLVMSAIARHEDGGEGMVNEVAAALCIADKSDVHRSRVRAVLTAEEAARLEDIHDRVNYSVTDSRLEVRRESREIRLDLTVDTAISTVMEYFEIFLDRMTQSREAARYLGAAFRLSINGTQLT